MAVLPGLVLALVLAVAGHYLSIYIGVDLMGLPKSPISAIMMAILLGILLIMLLVSIFVKPIQILTDGVRAIGEGSFDGQISVDGPAERANGGLGPWFGSNQDDEDGEGRAVGSAAAMTRSSSERATSSTPSCRPTTSSTWPPPCSTWAATW